MPEAADADHADFFTRPDVPVAQRRVCRDPGAQQRRDGGQLRFGMGYPQHVVFFDHDLLGIAAQSVARRVLGRAVIGQHHVVAVVFQPLSALFALLAAIDHAADAHQIADGVARDGVADRGHPTHNFMPRHAGIERSRPFRTRLVEIGVADAAVSDGDLYILWPRLAAGDGH